MHIAGVISFMRGWSLLSAEHPDALSDIRSAIGGLTLVYGGKAGHGGRPKVDVSLLHEGFKAALRDAGWASGVALEKSRQVRTVGFLKDRVAVEFFTSKHFNVESTLFLKLPLFYAAAQMRVGVILLPVRAWARHSPPGLASFEQFRDFFADIPPTALRYPFVILGMDEAAAAYRVQELTSDIDYYLEQETGQTLDEIVLAGEQAGVEFKEMMPASQKMSQEVCGLANRKGGGLLLLGVADDGRLTGVEDTDIDNIKMQVVSIVRSTCDPVPDVDFSRFPLHEAPGRSILVIKVSEVREKPCLVTGRAYIRVDASARIANSAEIRRLVLQ